MIRKTFFGAALLLLAAFAAEADVLYLANGGRVEGVVRVEGDHYVVEMQNGTARIRIESVTSRQAIPYVTEVYERRRSSIRDDDADAHFRLAMWCRSKGLADRSETHLLRVLRIDPDHAEVRSLRGEVKYGGVWMPREDANDLRMAKAGFLRFEGRWFTEDGLTAYLEAKKELLALEALAAEHRAAREAALRKAREEEERIAKIAAERKAIEAALKRAEADRIARDELIRENQRLLDRLRAANSGWGYDDGYGYGSGYRTWWPYGRSRYGGISRGSIRPGDHRGRGGATLGFSWTKGNFRVRGVVR